MTIPMLPSMGHHGVFITTSEDFQTEGGVTGWIHTEIGFEHFDDQPQPCLQLVLMCGNAEAHLYPHALHKSGLLSDHEFKQYLQEYCDFFFSDEPQASLDAYIALICKRFAERVQNGTWQDEQGGPT